MRCCRIFSFFFLHFRLFSINLARFFILLLTLLISTLTIPRNESGQLKDISVKLGWLCSGQVLFCVFKMDRDKVDILFSRRLKVMGERKSGEREEDTRGDRRSLSPRVSLSRARFFLAPIISKHVLRKLQSRGQYKQRKRERG